MTATHLYRGNSQGEILDADGKVVGRIVPVEPVAWLHQICDDQGVGHIAASLNEDIHLEDHEMCVSTPLLSAAPTDWSSVAVRVPERKPYLSDSGVVSRAMQMSWNECLDAIQGAK